MSIVYYRFNTFLVTTMIFMIIEQDFGLFKSRFLLQEPEEDVIIRKKPIDWGNFGLNDLEGGAIILKEDILNLILQAEKEYHNTVKNAVMEAKIYVDERKKMQSAYLEDLKCKWYLFEKTENEKFQKVVSDDKKKLELEMAEKKEQMKLCQKQKIDLISEQLKEEVLSFYGDR